jgi:hypothetical protein
MVANIIPAKNIPILILIVLKRERLKSFLINTTKNSKLTIKVVSKKTDTNVPILSVFNTKILLNLTCVMKPTPLDRIMLKIAIRKKFTVKNRSICLIEGIIMVICV